MPQRKEDWTDDQQRTDALVGGLVDYWTHAKNLDDKFMDTMSDGLRGDPFPPPGHSYPSR